MSTETCNAIVHLIGLHSPLGSSLTFDVESSCWIEECLPLVLHREQYPYLYRHLQTEICRTESQNVYGLVDVMDVQLMGGNKEEKALHLTCQLKTSQVYDPIQQANDAQFSILFPSIVPLFTRFYRRNCHWMHALWVDIICYFPFKQDWSLTTVSWLLHRRPIADHLRIQEKNPSHRPLYISNPVLLLTFQAFIS